MTVSRLDRAAEGTARVAILARADNDRVAGGIDEVEKPALRRNWRPNRWENQQRYSNQATE